MKRMHHLVRSSKALTAMVGIVLAALLRSAELSAAVKQDSLSEIITLAEARDCPLVYEEVLAEAVELDIFARDGMIEVTPSFDGKFKIFGHSVLNRDLSSLGQSLKDSPVIIDFKVEEPARLQISRGSKAFTIGGLQARARYEVKRTPGANSNLGGGGIFEFRKDAERVQVPFGDIWIRVEIPVELLLRAKVRTSGADVFMSGFDAPGLNGDAADFDVETNEGTVTLTRLTAKNIKVVTGSGPIWVNSCSGSFNLQTEQGDIYSSRLKKRPSH